MKYEFVLIVTKGWTGLYRGRRLLIQTRESPNSLGNLWSDDAEASMEGIKVVKCDYNGILPNNLDDVKKPVWNKTKTEVKYFRKVCP